MKPISDESCQRPGQGVLFPEFLPVEDEDPIESQLNLAARGSIAESLFDLWCMGKGVAVFRPCANQGKEDRIIQVNSRYLAVQIKSGGMGNSGKSTVFSIWAGNPYAAANGKPGKRRPKDDDAHLLVCIGLDYSNPSIETSFAFARPWSSSLPQTISVPNGKGWLSVRDLEAVVACIV